MTKEEKRERRAVRHALQAQAARYASRRIGLISTPAQVKAAAKKLTDRYISQAAVAEPNA